MRLTFLGTGAATPSRTRNVTGLALQFDQRRALWLFDCGEGTQHQILRSPLRLSQLERVFITHLHGDHFFGLLGLLASRSLQEGSDSPVTLYGPAGLDEFMRCALSVSRMRLRYPFTVETVKPGKVYEDDEYAVTCAPLAHGIECYGYAVQEKERPGRFDPERAKALGVPPGPLFGRLKNGATITLPDGRAVDGRALTGPTRPGRRAVVCGDTYVTPNTVALARDADVLVHEATYLHEDKPLADRALHSTAAMAAQAARDANARALILTHISPRYESVTGSRLPELLAEAQALFPNTYLAQDFWAYDVSRRETSP
ncbi:MAG: ribonuclease Z [Armatimonadetes bacterium]|nr:ribonuclease Z [Armatimonadota bacterium]